MVDKVDPPCPLIGKNSSDYTSEFIFIGKKAWPTYKDKEISKANYYSPKNKQNICLQGIS